jgi:hypothetical protein
MAAAIVALNDFFFEKKSNAHTRCLNGYKKNTMASKKFNG